MIYCINHTSAYHDDQDIKINIVRKSYYINKFIFSNKSSRMFLIRNTITNYFMDLAKTIPAKIQGFFNHFTTN